MDAKERQKLTEHAGDIRRLTLKSIAGLGVGHVGGALSIVELLSLLYFKYMRIDPKKPGMKDRDVLVLSKGHAGPALYATLALRGYFPEEWLGTLNRGGTRLPSHCDMNRTPGIDMTTGSLGQGISTAIGWTLARRLDSSEGRTFLILGDGETEEGQVWEGAMAAAHYRLDGLIAFIDHNKLQIDGAVKDVMDPGDLDGKWKSFGWAVQRCDGHDLEKLGGAIEHAMKENGRPSMIILDTVKAKGLPAFEGKVESHNMPFTMDMYEALGLEKR